MGVNDLWTCHHKCASATVQHAIWLSSFYSLRLVYVNWPPHIPLTHCRFIAKILPRMITNFFLSAANNSTARQMSLFHFNIPASRISKELFVFQAKQNVRCVGLTVCALNLRPGGMGSSLSLGT
jgi:hypothetical protein